MVCTQHGIKKWVQVTKPLKALDDEITDTVHYVGGLSGPDSSFYAELEGKEH